MLYNKNMNMQKRVVTSPLFYIEGNTGSGKTTLLRALAQRNPDFVTLEEPVTDVQNVQGINALHMMYADQKRWSLTVYLLYYAFHIKQLKKTILSFSKSVIVSDRSIYSGLAFSYADQVAGVLHPLENILYEQLIEIASSTLAKPYGFIYVRTKPEISFERINKRKRAEETKVPFNYWKSLHEAHERMFFQKNNFINDIPVLVLDYDSNADKNEAISEAIQRIEVFIKTCIQKHSGVNIVPKKVKPAAYSI